MNALFLVSESLADSGGISKKILAQVNALKCLGINVDLAYLANSDKNECIARYINREIIIDKYSNIAIVSKFQWRCNYKNLYNYIHKNEIKLVYIRYIHFANPFFIYFLKKLKKDGIIILMEIPTYPYDQEYRDLKFTSKIVLMIEKFSRLRFKNYVTRIITLTHHTKIFGIPSIQISNGIDASSINMIKKSRIDKDIYLVAVASMAYWHGYDRVIEGLHKYYSCGTRDKKSVFFHIAGDNTNAESIRCKELVKKYNLSKYVIFHGRKSGIELDNFFNNADLAVGSLGCHRISLKNIKSLKSREYCARGLPFFYSATDEDFENEDFILKVPANDAPIDIDLIVKFVVNHKFDTSKIRNYALENLTWNKQFEKVLHDIFPNLHTPVNSSTLAYGSLK